MVNRCLETYLHCMTSDLSKNWSSCESLARFLYNTILHTIINLTPFQALYGVPPPIHLPYFSRDSLVEIIDKLLQDKEASIQLLNYLLSKAR